MEHAEPGSQPPSGGSRTTADDALRGRVLDGRYRIGSRIARGGMASVYEAHDLRLDREVAVKVMHSGLADAGGEHDFAERFVREARAAARLSHPNVVSVYDQGDDGGTVFLAMELVTGHTLRDTILKESPMSPARAVAMIEPVLAALAEAHRSGLIHRDIKPENVLIADDGRVKVADFGLARAVSADTRHTATQGVLIGTVSYLAPELVVDGRADARADVYAVGVVLYELLTGVKPHEGETPIQVAYKHVHHDVPAPSQLVPEIPAYVDALVARATARDPGLRPADAGVMLRQARRVAHALEDGVRDDPELTLDLSPWLGRVGTDTTPEDLREPGWSWEDSGIGGPASPAGSPEHTRTLPRAEPDDDAAGPPEPAHLSHPSHLSSMPPPRPSAPPRSPRPERPARAPRRRRRGLLLVALALVAALAVGGGAFWFGWARYSPAPSVVGLSQSDAAAKLHRAGLKVTVADPVYDPDVPAGQVIEADPAGGERVLDGDTVTITVSLGVLRAPKVAGLAEDDAQDAVLTRQLQVGDPISRYSETVPEGVVIGSRPQRGTRLDPGDTVALIVSKGRRPRDVGSWVGKPIDTATARLQQRGLVAVVDSEEYSDDVEKGVIISQDPTGGTLFKDGEVHFVVSRGPHLVQVPSVKAQGVSSAQQELEDAGFKVDVVPNPGFYAGLGIAVKTDPDAGSMVPKGSTITLYEI